MIWQRIRRLFRHADVPSTQTSDVVTPPENATPDAYQRAFQRHTPASWDFIELSQGDVLTLLVDRVPADAGVTAILGVSVLFGNDPTQTAHGHTLLQIILDDLTPARSDLMLLTLGDAWQAAEHQPYDDRAGVIRAEMLRSLRRLTAIDLPASDRLALQRIEALLSEAGSVLCDER